MDVRDGTGRPVEIGTRAAELPGCAHALQGFVSPWILENDRPRAAALAALGADAFDAAARGRRITRAQALALTPDPIEDADTRQLHDYMILAGPRVGGKL